jgi:hypothetical protein
MAKRVIPFPGLPNSRLVPVASVDRRSKVEIRVAGQVYIIEVNAQVRISLVPQPPTRASAQPDMQPALTTHTPISISKVKGPPTTK